jgi:hypothetical protein
MSRRCNHHGSMHNQNNHNHTHCSGKVVTENSSRCGCIPYIFFLLGIGVLVPWNAFISSKVYYESRFCTDDPNDVVPQQQPNSHNNNNHNNIESIFATVYNVSSVITMVVLIGVQLLRDRWSQYSSNNNSNRILPSSSSSHPEQQQQHCTMMRTQSIPFSASLQIPSMTSIVGVEMSEQQQQPQYYYNDNKNNANNTMSTTRAVGNNHHHDEWDPLYHNNNNNDNDASRTMFSTPSSIQGTTQHANRNETEDLQQQQQLYSLYFVILPFIILIFVFVVQAMLVIHTTTNSMTTTASNMYTITLLCIALCGIASAILGTGIVTVIANGSSSSCSSHSSGDDRSTAFHSDAMMNPYQIVRVSVAVVVVDEIHFLSFDVF